MQKIEDQDKRREINLKLKFQSLKDSSASILTNIMKNSLGSNYIPTTNLKTTLTARHQESLS